MLKNTRLKQREKRRGLKEQDDQTDQQREKESDRDLPVDIRGSDRDQIVGRSAEAASMPKCVPLGNTRNKSSLSPI